MADSVKLLPPFETWLDIAGNPINAHGGGMMFHQGRYYWYGECRPAGPSTLNAMVGVACYSSTDLLAWRPEGTVLAVVHGDPAHPLAAGSKIERPKCVYNSRTGRFVLWWHHDRPGWGHAGALAGVAVSDSPTGPFVLERIFRPHHLMFRDCTVFQDDDGTAHLVFATDDNANLCVCPLDDDYLVPTAAYTKQFSGRYMEAPCLWKRNGLYYFIGSDCSGWHPNEARSATAPTLRGPWREHGNPCRGRSAELTFGTQSTCVFRVHGRDDQWVFMADQWRPEQLADSRYLWLPVTFAETVPGHGPRPFVTLAT